MNVEWLIGLNRRDMGGRSLTCLVSRGSPSWGEGLLDCRGDRGCVVVKGIPNGEDRVTVAMAPVNIRRSSLLVASGFLRHKNRGRGE